MSALLRQACGPGAAIGVSLMRGALQPSAPLVSAALGLTSSSVQSFPAALHAAFQGAPLRSFAADAATSKAVPTPPDFVVGAPSKEDASEGGHAGRTFADDYIAPHKGLKQELGMHKTHAHDAESFMPHPVYGADYLESVKPRHMTANSASQYIGRGAVWIMRSSFDLLSGYSKVPGKMSEAQWLRRIIFLETVAGVPGMVAGMSRHLKSLRSMQKDGGWIHSLLEEAENERMHLLTFLQLRQPGLFFRSLVILAQGVFFNAYFIGYLLSPKTAHAFVGYLEEEAVKTYTHALEDIDAGHLWKDAKAPAIAVTYWNLPEGASMRDLILAVRADEACHSHVNHVLSQRNLNGPNPFAHDTQATLP